MTEIYYKYAFSRLHCVCMKWEYMDIYVWYKQLNLFGDIFPKYMLNYVFLPVK